MRISKLSLKNYRTLQDIVLEFPSYYSAICGKNDSGKTNVVRAIRCLMKEEDPYAYPKGPEFSITEDFTKWSDIDIRDRKISVGIELVVDSERDAGLHEFLLDFLTIENPPRELFLSVEVIHSTDDPPDAKLKIAGQEFSGRKAEEVLLRLQTSRTFLFHSSTDPKSPYYGRGFRGVLRDISEEYTRGLDNAKRGVDRMLKKIAREQQQEIEELLGRLRDKYRVGLSWPTFDLSYFPYNVMLGDSKVDVKLEDWGSGTRNRTMTLFTIFRAKQMADSSASASKSTPIIVVEEPESFLHPLAQAEFGRVLQDLAQEFRIQIIVTTHSPYLLNQNHPESNILLQRRVIRRQLRQTELVDTSGDKWMEPFALALGICDEEFRPWRDLFLTSSSALLLVEGEIDKEYFTLFQDPAHGSNRLNFDGEIFAYGGKDTLKNQALLRFLLDRYEKLFVTFDLDGEMAVERCLRALGLERKKDYMTIGMDQPGKRNIEGLLPDSVRIPVYADNPDLVQALSGTAEERRDAKRRLKILLLECFKSNAISGEEYYGLFYPIIKAANRKLG